VNLHKKRFPISILKKSLYPKHKSLNEKLFLFQLGYALYRIVNHRDMDSVMSFLEDNNDKKKENSETAKFAKETKKVL
jgi:hypothetical protein